MNDIDFNVDDMGAWSMSSDPASIKVAEKDPAAELAKEMREREAQEKAEAAAAAREKQEALAKGGYVALGHDGKHSVVWSKLRQVIVPISASDITSPGTLMSVCGNEWIELQPEYAQYHIDKKTFAKTKIGVNYRKLAGEIVDACSKAGAYNAAAVRGAGVWRSDDDNNVLVINGKDVFRTDGKPIERIGTKHVYRHSRDIGITAETQPSTVAEVHDLLKTLQVWNFKRKSDARLMLGWLACGAIAGALTWRTPASLTGPAGSGKSTLLRLMSNILGDACMLVDGGSTTAGVRQALGNDAIVYMSDEAEADGAQLATTLNFIRSASSGAEVLRGTQDQAGKSYTARFVGLIAGIVPPALNAADASRFMLLELNKLPVGTGIQLPFMAGDNCDAQSEAKQFGRRFIARMVNNWARFQVISELVKSTMRKSGDSSRFADTLGGPIAAAWVSMTDDMMTPEQAVEWIKGFDLSESRELVAETDDAGDLIQHIMSQSVNVQGRPFMLSQIAQIALSDNTINKDFANVLAQYGLRAEVKPGTDKLRIAVWDKSPQLVQLLRESRWRYGNLKPVLMRVPGAEKVDSMRIGGQTRSNVISVPTSIEHQPSITMNGLSMQTATTCAYIASMAM